MIHKPITNYFIQFSTLTFTTIMHVSRSWNSCLPNELLATVKKWSADNYIIFMLPLIYLYGA